MGSQKHQAGLFALDKIDRFDLLYLPPPGKHRDVGPMTVLAAERYCRGRGAMLIIDPPDTWHSAPAAVSGMRDLGLASPNLIAYYPRMRQRDSADSEARVAGGAVAGLLCKLDRTYGAWNDIAQADLAFNRSLRPAVDVDQASMPELFRAGLNVIATGPAGQSRLPGSVTLRRDSDAHKQVASLPIRRLCLQVLNTIEEATRWAVFEADSDRLADRIRAQVTAYLACLADLGAFENEQFFVECDAGLRKREPGAGRGFAIFVAFQPRTCKQPLSFTLHQSAAGCRIASSAFAPSGAGLESQTI